MVQPKKPPIGIRPPLELLAAIDAVAEQRKLSRHAAILWLISRGLAAEAVLTAERIANTLSALDAARTKPTTATEILAAEHRPPKISVSLPLATNEPVKPGSRLKKPKGAKA